MLPIAKSIDNADSINYAFNILVGLQKHCGNADKLVDLGNDVSFILIRNIFIHIISLDNEE